MNGRLVVNIVVLEAGWQHATVHGDEAQQVDPHVVLEEKIHQLEVTVVAIVGEACFVQEVNVALGGQVVKDRDHRKDPTVDAHCISER